jgi:hypothetical protein
MARKYSGLCVPWQSLPGINLFSSLPHCYVFGGKKLIKATQHEGLPRIGFLCRSSAREQADECSNLVAPTQVATGQFSSLHTTTDSWTAASRADRRHENYLVKTEEITRRQETLPGPTHLIRAIEDKLLVPTVGTKIKWRPQLGQPVKSRRYSSLHQLKG